MIEIKGIKAAQALINRKTSDRVRERAMMFAATEMKNMAEHLYAPEKLGILKKLIYKRKEGKLHYKIGCDAPYAVFHEYGSYNIQSGSPQNPNIIKTGYSPFIRPAIWRTMKKFPQIFKYAFEDE